jgi:hypothetical protein
VAIPRLRISSNAPCGFDHQGIELHAQFSLAMIFNSILYNKAGNALFEQALPHPCGLTGHICCFGLRLLAVRIPLCPQILMCRK